MRPMTITRDVQINLAIHNAGIDRSRREYEEHPLASCPYPDCWEMVHEGRCCDEHWRALVENRERRRIARARKKAAA